MTNRCAFSALDGDVGTVRLVGEVDMTHAEEVRDSILALFDEGASRVDLDMSHVTFMDSTGLGAIVEGSDGGPVAVTTASAVARRVIEVSGLGGFLHIDAAAR